MKAAVIAHLDQLVPLSPALQQWLKDRLRERRLSRYELLLRPGEVSDAIAFIVKGFLRSYSISAKGLETTVWFMKEMDVVISVRSFFERLPGEEYIEALEPSVLLYLTYDELQEAYGRFPEFNTLGRQLTERYYVQAENRLTGLRNKTAAERYRFLLARHPEIFDRAALQHIASYLDISRGTLSRLRAMPQQDKG
jgi:CRP/FNR family transcriptional regulator, anaerobic regulatory protein